MSKGDPAPISVGRAIVIGLVWVNGPIFPIMFGLPLLIVSYTPWFGGGGDVVGAANGVLLSAVFVAGFIAAWLWWSVNVPKWRLWAYERVNDIPELKRRAVAIGLTWPDGHFFERTEIKSNAHAARERELEGRRR